MKCRWDEMQMRCMMRCRWDADGMQMRCRWAADEIQMRWDADGMRCNAMRWDEDEMLIQMRCRGEMQLMDQNIFGYCFRRIYEKSMGVKFFIAGSNSTSSSCGQDRGFLPLWTETFLGTVFGESEKISLQFFLLQNRILRIELCVIWDFSPMRPQITEL